MAKKIKFTTKLADLIKYEKDFNFKKQKINFQSKNFNDTKAKAAKFEGYLEFIYDDNNLIYCINWRFQKLTIDLMTTQSWFKGNGTASFNYRKKYFAMLGLNQIIRPNKTDHQLLELDKNQIEIFNNYLNYQYDGTVKGVINIIKGSNPRGSVTSPENEEMVRNDSINKNFVLFVKQMKIEENFIQDPYFKGGKDLFFKTTQNDNSYFENLKDPFKALYQSLNTYSRGNQSIKEKNVLSYKILQKIVEEDLRILYNANVVFENWLNKNVIKCRSIYQNNINKLGNVITFDNLRKTQFEKAHIYQVKWVKQKLRSIWEKDKTKNFDNPKYKKALEMISDVNNFLSLENEAHRFFDEGLFTYEKTGKMLIINENEKIQEFLGSNDSHKYLKIKEEALIKARIDYLNLRNEKIFQDKNKF